MNPGSCDVSDACDRLGIAAFRTGVFAPIWPDCQALAGPLITISLEPAKTGTPLDALLEVLADATDRVALVDLDGRLDVQCWGTVLATAARRFGVRGALVNGAVRDVEGLRELGCFPTFARGVFPAAIRGRLSLSAVGSPIELEGRAIDPDDFVVADASGAVFLPADSAAQVLATATELRVDEEKKLRAAADGADPRLVFGTGDEA